MHGSSLTYAWLSDGTKVSARADDGSGNGVVKRYLGSFVFTTSGGSSTEDPADVESAAWDEGRIFFYIPEAVPEEYIEDPDLDPEPEINPDEPEQIEVWFPYRDCWFAGDHLGNVRSVIDITPDLSAPQILEQSDYLPFGTKISNSNLISGMNNRWRYAGKEEQRFGLAGAFSPIGNAPFSGTGFLDLALLDFGARMYDPFTARWTAADPLAVIASNYTVFNYCGLNPIRFIDLFGLWRQTEDGTYLAEVGDNAATFAETYNMSLEDAQNYLDTYGYIESDGSYSLPAASICAEQNNEFSSWYSTITTVLGWGLPDNPNYTFRLRTNNKPIAIHVYQSGWERGNQHVARKYLHSTKALARTKRFIVRPIGNVMSIYSAYVSFQKAGQDTSSAVRFEYIADAVMDCVGIIPTWPTQALSLYYDLGGKTATEHFLDYTSTMLQSNPYYRPFGMY